MAALLGKRKQPAANIAPTTAGSSGSAVTNFYELIPEDTKKDDQNPHKELHHLKIPFRMLIVGTSGSMKTNTALDIIQKMADTFYSITLLCRAADEPLYRYLRAKVPSDQLKIIEVDKDDLSDMPTIESFDKTVPHLVIFDDLVLMKDQSPIEEFFIRCRKFNVSVMYLAQSYFKTPKTIRINCNYILLKKIPSINDLKAILREYALGVTIEELEQMYSDCTSNQLHWLTIAMENPPEKRFYCAYEVIGNGQARRPIGSIGDDAPPMNQEASKEITDFSAAPSRARARGRGRARVRATDLPEFMRHLPPDTIDLIQQRLAEPRHM